MFDNFKNLKELDQAKKLFEEIKKEIREIEEDGRRYNKQGELGVKAQKEVLDLKYKQINAEGQIKKLIDEREKQEKTIGKDQLSFQKELNKLAKKSNTLAKSKKGIILNNFGLEVKNQQFIDGAKKASTMEEKNAFKELEQLRLDSLDELAEGTFDLDVFNSKLGNIDLPDNLKEAAGEFQKSFEIADEKAEDIKKAMDMNLPFLDKIEEFRTMAEMVKSTLGSTKLLGLALAGLVLKAITDFVMQAKEVRQNLGASAKDSFALSVDMTTASKAAFLMGGDTEKASQAIQSLAQNMGRVPQLSQASAAQFGVIASLSGATAESVATIAELNALATGQSVDKSIADLKSLEAISKQAGVLKSGVFEDVAQAAKDQALFFGKSAEEIAKAAVEMRKLGIEASALNALAESLLDLESSINSEFELQVLFGKNINLNAARKAAFDRDGVALSQELRRQLGGQFDLNKANFAQVKALTDAFGLSQEQLQKVIQGQDIFNSKADEAEKGAMSLTAKFGALGALLVGIAGAIVGTLTLGAGVKASLAGAVKGGVGGIAVGASLGALAGAAMGTKMEDAHIAIDKKPVGSQAPGATFSLGDTGSINVSKETQTAIDLHTTELKKVLREEVAVAIRDLAKSNTSKLEGVKTATEDVNRSIRNLG